MSEAVARDPRKARAIAELEVSLVENLPRERYHRITLVQGRCYAWRVYLTLVDSTTHGDADTLAATHRAIALCSMELGELDEAETNLRRAITLNQQLAQPVEVLQERAALGRLMIRRGDTATGIASLRLVRRELLQHGLTEEAGLCGLEVVEAMLIAGNASAAVNLTRQIVGELVNAGVDERAVAAVRRLQEAFASGRVSPELVSQVRESMAALQCRPERGETE